MKMYEQKKVGREWVDTGNVWEGENAKAYLCDKLANELMAKYIDKATWVKRIEKDYFYSSEYYKVVAIYNNGYRSVYLIDR